MNKFLILFLVPLISLGLVSCNDEEDVKPINMDLFFAGTWEVVELEQNSQGPFAFHDILVITSSKIHENYGGYIGDITTYHHTSDGIRQDKFLSWSWREVENYQPLIELICQAELDNDNPWAGNYFYKVISLDNSYMLWKGNMNGDNSTIKFRRRSDINFDK